MPKLKPIVFQIRYACYVIGHDWQWHQQQLQVWRQLPTTAHG